MDNIIIFKILNKIRLVFFFFNNINRVGANVTFHLKS